MSQLKQQQKYITVSVRDLELNQIEDRPALNDISCYLTVFTEDKETKDKNNQLFDLLLLTDPQNTAKFKLTKGENQFLKVQLKTLSEQKLIGSVSINLSIFGESSNISVDQWINLIIGENVEQQSNVSTQLKGTPLKSKQEGTCRIKMRFQVHENETVDKAQVENIETQQYDTERNQLNTTLQPCVNFPIKDKKRKYDFTPILNHAELNQTTEQSILNIESRLVLTPERIRIQENSVVFQNKFQELIEKLMETRNQSFILGVTRQLNESHRRDLEKNNLTEILKRLNESQNYMEDDLLENPEQELNNIHLSLSGIHQNCKKQASPEPFKRNKCDLEGEVASLRLELEKKQEIEQQNKDLKVQVFNLERNNENLLNQYNKAVDNYQKYFIELNEENHELKKKVAIIEKESQLKDKSFSELKQSFDEKLKSEKLKLQNEIIQQSIKNADIIEQSCDKEELNPDKIQAVLLKHNQMLLEAQNESVELQAKMQEMQKEIESLTQKVKSQASTNDISTNIEVNQNHQQENNSFDKSAKQAIPNLKKKLSEEDEAYFEKLIKEKSLKITQLEGEKSQAEFITQKSENKIAQLNEKLQLLEKQLQNASSNEQNDWKLILEENSKLKNQINESEQLRSTLEDHLIKTKQNFLKKIEDLQQKQIQNNHDSKIHKAKDESLSMKKLVDELNQKSTFINDLTYQIKDFKVMIQALQEKVKILEFNANESDQLKKSVKELEAEKDKINSDLYAVTEDLLKKTTESISQQQIISQLSNEVKKRDKMIEDLLLRNPSQQMIYNPKKGDEIDEKLCEYLSQNVTPIKFVRIEEGLYNFGTKRIIVKLLKGKLVCRVGGGFMIIEEFLQLYTLQELIKMKQTGDFSLLNYPISEDKIDQLIQQDIQFNQQQYKQLQESNNNFNIVSSKQQLESSSNGNPQSQQNQSNMNLNYKIDQHYIPKSLRNSTNNQETSYSQQSQLCKTTNDCYFQNYNKNSLLNSSNNINISPNISKQKEVDQGASFENGDDCQKENNQIRASYLIDQRTTPQRGENSYFKNYPYISSIQQSADKNLVNQSSNAIQQSSSSSLTPVYQNRTVRSSTNQQSNQIPSFLNSSEEKTQQMTQHEKNQEMLRYLREQAQNDVHLRSELESLQNTIQMAANIKGSEIIRKYSIPSQNTYTAQQLQTFEGQLNQQNNNNLNNSINPNNTSGSKISSSQYPIDFTNSNYNYHMRNSMHNGTSRLNGGGSSSKPPSTYSIRVTPQKQKQTYDNQSANTSAINEMTPQHVNSKAATPKRNESSTSAYQERILKQYSHKRNPAENFSPYKHSSITQTFSAQKKLYSIHK